MHNQLLSFVINAQKLQLSSTRLFFLLFAKLVEVERRQHSAQFSLLFLRLSAIGVRLVVGLLAELDVHSTTSSSAAERREIL